MNNYQLAILVGTMWFIASFFVDSFFNKFMMIFIGLLHGWLIVS